MERKLGFSMELRNSHPQHRFGKILVMITEDWFAWSHFRPLLSVLVDACNELVLLTRLSSHEAELMAMGARVVAFDFERGSSGFAAQASRIVQLCNLLRRERPDVIHLVAMKPIVLGSVAALAVPRTKIVMHFTGLGHLFISGSRTVAAARALSMSTLRRIGKSRKAWVLAENETDLADLQKAGLLAEGRTALMGGAGIDPDVYPELCSPNNLTPIMAVAARMIRSKGVDVLVEAHSILRARGLAVRLELHGRTDPDNPEAIPSEVLESWKASALLTLHGHTPDIVSIWRRADISVLPARSREGMPRAILEAASCGRPLVVTNVPGSHHFVRDGIEGFIVRPDDPVALADAIEKLVRNPALRQRMGAAARARVLSGFTQKHAEDTLRGVYARLAES